MAFQSLLFFALAAVSLAAPSPSLLRVTITPASASVKSSDVALSATVTNPTSEDIKFVRFGSILDTLPTRSFTVTKDEKDVFPDLGHKDSWVTIPAGQSITVDHKIGFNYDFITAGPGKYSFKPITRFQFGPTTSEIAVIQTAATEIDVTDAEPLARTEKTNPTCSDGSKKNFIASALSEARALAGGAAADVRSHPNSSPYKNYFGNSNRDTVWYLFDRIAGDLASSGTRQLHCTDPNGFCSANPGAVAYTSVALSNGKIVGSDIFACAPFFTFPVTHKGVCSGSLVNTRGGVLLHELTHAVAATTDIYGCDNVKKLPDNQQVNNADNYACFASQIHRNYDC